MNLASASGYETKARPPPPRTTSLISVSRSCARLPRMAKIVTPASSEVKVSVRLMIHASLGLEEGV